MTRFTRASAPRHAIYFELFTDAARNMERAAALLLELLSGYPDNKELAAEILDLEHEGDRITHDVIDRLNHRDVNRPEKEGDRLTREAVASLFDGGIDPMVVIRWKDLFERLEEAIDACERAANIIEGIVIKNS